MCGYLVLDFDLSFSKPNLVAWYCVYWMSSCRFKHNSAPSIVIYGICCRQWKEEQNYLDLFMIKVWTRSLFCDHFETNSIYPKVVSKAKYKACLLECGRLFIYISYGSWIGPQRCHFRHMWTSKPPLPNVQIMEPELWLEIYRGTRTSPTNFSSASVLTHGC